MPPSKLQRQLDLIAYLVGRNFPVTVEELMEKLPAYAAKWRSGDAHVRQSVRRMFERDKDDLRAFGIPLRTTKYTVDGEELEGYEIRRRDFYLPYLKLIAGAPTADRSWEDRRRVAEVEITEGDAPLALDALRRAASIPSFPLIADARSAFRKLAFDLDPAAFAGGPPVLFVDRPGAEELQERLEVVADALLARKRLRFRYRGIYRGEETERAVAGYALLFQHGHWYLIGHDATRNDLRVFRVGRMDQVSANQAAPRTPDYEVPEDFNLREYVDREAWELGDRDEQPVVAQVSFRFPQSLLAERNRHGRLIEQRADGSSVRAFEVHQVNPFLRWVLSQEGEAEILSPPELVEELRALARAVAQAHEEQSHAAE